MKYSNRLSRGFSLLEILIAMAIFAIMASMAYAGLRGVLQARELTEKHSETIAQLQQLMYLLNEDLSQAVSRSVRDELGSDEPAFSGGDGQTLLTFTRNLPDWSGLSTRSNLQRIRYVNENGMLYRQVWTTLDRTQQSQYRRKKILQVESIDVRFYSQEWASHWSSAGGSSLPKAVEMTLVLPRLGEIRRLFLVQQ
ncbi:type II secretion system protein GspJ [Methylomonas lenta]|uniref:Type II secretion system protein J n=1 Tax=Methylomonas lenta TaxID=980561 RepID=A0A177N150_9GAMM|nr:type II secretion system minor pseudopilin GspJ [Methylomonas lenta]OAI11688.1 type II secretion system protein GspJ [Methylomonas lenta]